MSGLRLTGWRLGVQRVLLGGIGAFNALGLVGYAASSPPAAAIARCGPASHPWYLAAAAALLVLVALAFVTSRGRPAVSWLVGVGLVQVLTGLGVSLWHGFGGRCTYSHPRDGVGGMFVLFATFVGALAVVADFPLFGLEWWRRRQAAREIDR